MKTKSLKNKSELISSESRNKGGLKLPPIQGADSSSAENEKLTALDAGLVSRFGDPVFFTVDGEVSGVNERFFAARFHQQEKTLYEPGENNFYE